MKTSTKWFFFLVCCVMLLTFVSQFAIAQETICIAPDNGGGTVDLPAFCPYYTTPADATIDIIDGLPPGSVLKSHAARVATAVIKRISGGSLGGEIVEYIANLTLDMYGTGIFSGYHRTLVIEQKKEVHLGPRTPNARVQSISTVLYYMQGQLPPGDPDFDLLRITAGTGLGLPSPGHTTLTRRMDGNWNVDSFFDITYRIDFVGAPGGPFAGMSGTTIGTIRMQQGSPTAEFEVPLVVAIDGSFPVLNSVMLDPANQPLTFSFFDIFTELSLDFSGSTRYLLDPMNPTIMNLTGHANIHQEGTGLHQNIPVVVVIQTTPVSTSGSITTFDTEMLSMNLSSGSPGFMLRESPTRASTGRLIIRESPTLQSRYFIGSFFDIWTELSMDGGVTWTPADTSIKIETKIRPTVLINRPDPPPPFGRGIFVGHDFQASDLDLIQNLSLTNKSASSRPLVGETIIHTSSCDMEYMYDGLSRLVRNVPYSIRLHHTFDNGSDQYFDTEMLQLDLVGGTLPSNVRLRESPTRASSGKTSIQFLGGDQYRISSFFDIFTELSIDDGATWTPQPPVSLEYVQVLSGPTITSISPTSGPVGTLVKISGTGFSNTPSENLVAMGDKFPFVKSSTQTQLDVIIPHGASTNEVIVSVNGLSSLPPHKVFTVLPNVVEYFPLINNSDILDIQLGDIDGDGFDDPIVRGKIKAKDSSGVGRKEWVGHVSLLKRYAKGFQALSSDVSITSIPDVNSDPDFTRLLHADCDGDGIVDYLGFSAITVPKQTQGATFGEKVLVVLENEKTQRGKLKSYRRVLLQQGRALSSAAFVQLTNDDSLDAACAYEPGGGSPPQFDMIRNIGKHGSMRISSNITDGSVNDFAFADLDNDGDNDVVVATENGVCIFEHNASTFEFVRTQTIDGIHPYSGVAIGDLDGDGHPDLVALRSDSGIVNMCFGDPLNPGSVKTPREVGSGMATGKRQHKPINITDVNGDGRPDIVCAGDVPSRTTVCLLNGLPPGEPVITFTAISLDDCDDDGFDKLFAVGKFDSDNYCDFIFLGCRSTSINPPLVSSMSPDVAPAGTLVTIEGENLGDASSVRFGDFEASFIRESPTKLTVTVPSSARTFAVPHVLERVSVTCPSGQCDIVKPFTVSPVLSFSPPQFDQLPIHFAISGDVDGDGRDDAVMLSRGNCCRGHVIIMKAYDDEGSASARSAVTTFFYDDDEDCDGLATGDFDGDGRLDVCVALSSATTASSRFIILFGDATRPNMFRESPTLSSRQKLWMKSNFRLRTMAPAMKDIDGDGKSDLVFAIQGTSEDTLVIITDPVSETNSKIRKLRGRTNYAALTLERLSSGSSSFDIFALSSTHLDRINYVVGGPLTLSSSATLRESPTRRSLACRDLNGDGLTDAVILDDDSSLVTVCFQQVDGSYKIVSPRDAMSGIPTGKRLHLALTDLDGDGRCDIAIDEPGVQFAPSRMKSNSDLTYQKIEWTVLYNQTVTGDSVPAFEEKTIVMDDRDASDNEVCVGDLDGDGVQDIVVVGTSSSVAAPPFIRALSTSRVAAGRQLYCWGGNLSSVSSVDVCNPCVATSSYSALSDSELVVVLPQEYGNKFLNIFNADGSAGLASPITILSAPDMFVSLPPESLTISDVAKKFIKPVKRGKKLYPNWANLLQEVVVQGGFQPGASESDNAGGLRIGISHISEVSPGKWKPIKDSAKVRAWVVVRGWDSNKKAGKNWANIQKTLQNKEFTHTKIGRGLDSTGAPGDLKRKFLKGELKGLDPKKTSNKLFAELVALKFNIAASQLGKTPVGFGELIYENDLSVFDEMSIVEISRKADSAMTYYFDNDVPDYEHLYLTIYEINRAFVGPLDTASFEVGRSLTLDGAVDLATCTFLKFPPGPFIPLRLLATNNLTESVDDIEGMEDVETLLTAAKLYQNYPNPFNPTTAINFGLKENSIVSLKIYNTLGQEVATLLDNETVDAGNKSVEFDASKLSSGVYFYRLNVESISQSEEKASSYTEQYKMILLK